MYGSLTDQDPNKDLVQETTVVGTTKKRACLWNGICDRLLDRGHGITGLCPEAGGPQHRGRDISISSNSQVAMKALVVPATSMRLVGECKEALGRVTERNRLRLFCVSGHAGIPGLTLGDWRITTIRGDCSMLGNIYK